MSTPIAAPTADRGPAEARRLARELKSLPALPAALREVLWALQQAQAPSHRCIDLIERDQALAAVLLRLANSAFFGLPGQVHRVADAVQLLGLRTVAGALAATSLQAMVAPGARPPFNFERHWQLALLTASAARRLAQRQGLDVDVALLAGLMANMGRLAQALLRPAARPQGAAAAPATEDDTLDSGLLGAVLLEHWHFPPAVVQAVAPDGFLGAQVRSEARTAAMRQAVATAALLASVALAEADQPMALDEATQALARCGVHGTAASDLLADLTQMARGLATL